jgi:hypothetical protein
MPATEGPTLDASPGATGAGGAEERSPAAHDATAAPAEAAGPALSEIALPTGDSPPLAPEASHTAASDAATIPHEPEDIESVAARRMPATPTASRRRLASPESRLPLLVLMLVVICAAIIGWRKDIVRHLPQMASFYGAVGLPVNVRGLVFTDVRVASDMHDGVPVLTVDGTIANVVSSAVEVPRLRFALRNAAGAEVYSWTAMPTQTVLGPGETLPLRSRLASPPGDIHDVQLRFFNRRDAAAGLR